MLPVDRQSFSPVTATLKDGSAVVLRLLEPSDANALGDFYESVPREDYRHYAPHRLDREQANIKAATLADSAQFICVIGLNISGQIVGYAWCDWKRPDDDCCGLGICVRRRYQGMGAGTIVLHRLLEIVRKAGPPLVHLTVNKANPQAFALYQKMGFTVVREQIRSKIDQFAPEPEYYMEQMLR